MVKIKNFTLASQNLGGGGMCPPPRALHTGRPCVHILCKKFLRGGGQVCQKTEWSIEYLVGESLRASCDLQKNT